MSSLKKLSHIVCGTDKNTVLRGENNVELL